MIDKRLAICALGSVVAHFVFAESLSILPERAHVTIPQRIEIRVVAAPPPPPPPPPPAPEPEPPKPEVHEAPRPTPRAAATRAAKPVDTPLSTTTPTTTETTTAPVYGFQMSSSSSAGPAVARGNTPQPTPPASSPGPAKPLAAPAAAVEVTKMPLPLGRCSGKYTDAAKAAGIEGTVVLDLIVDEQGRARDIQVTEALTHGLTEAAVAAVQSCKFTPGERAGQPVPVRVRGFKIRFFLQDG